MLFNSFEFLIFLPTVFVLYWFVFKHNIKVQNIFIILVSYLFYGWWDWRFLGLIILSSITDYTLGVLMSKTEAPKRRKFYLITSILFNLGILGFFKYYNFFLDSFVDLLNVFAGDSRYETSWSLAILLPVGISFYTFQTMSYTIDVYRKRIEATKDIFAFFAFVTFFPQLVAGPIERASNLLPQFLKTRQFDFQKSVDGCRQILWGFFKKVVIADSVAIYVNQIFENSFELSGFILLVGVIFFAIQIYCDFSGYSDIAIGTARLFGFNLLANFRTPYFATSTADLWRRWHISLSTYANEYLFLPLSSAFSKLKRWAILLSLVLTFTIIGLWHGANWTFVVFGLWNGALSAVEYSSMKRRRLLAKKVGTKVFNFFGWIITMLGWLIGMTFFRAESVGHAVSYLQGIIDPSTFFSDSYIMLLDFKLADFFYEYNYLLLFFCFLLFLLEYINKNYEHGLARLINITAVRWASYSFLIVLVVLYFGQETDFIYFQF